MKMLVQKDPSGGKLVQACKDKSKVMALQEDLQRRLMDFCSHAPSSLKSRCEEHAGENHVETLCASTSGKESLEQNMLKFDLARVRLDGLLSGLCDDLEGFFRGAPRIAVDNILQSAQHATSLLEKDEGQTLEQTGVVDWFGIIGLVYSAIGCTDFALDMYDTAVNKNQGFAVLLNFVQEEANSQKKTMCRSFSQYWLQAIKVTSWASALMGARFAEAGIDTHLLGSKDLLMLDWKLNIHKGSHWICDQLKNCLVPAESVHKSKSSSRFNSDYTPDQMVCHLPGRAYYRVCGRKVFGSDVPEETVTASVIAPEACFTAKFSRKDPVWVMTFADGNSSNYDEKKKAACDQPFDDLTLEGLLTPCCRNCNAIAIESRLGGDICSPSLCVT